MTTIDGEAMPFKEHTPMIPKAAKLYKGGKYPKELERKSAAPTALRDATTDPRTITKYQFFTDPNYEKSITGSKAVRTVDAEPTDAPGMIETALFKVIDDTLDPTLFPNKDGNVGRRRPPFEEHPEHLFEAAVSDLFEGVHDYFYKHVRKSVLAVLEKNGIELTPQQDGELTETLGDIGGPKLMAMSELPVTQFCKDLKRMLERCWHCALYGDRRTQHKEMDLSDFIRAVWNDHIRCLSVEAPVEPDELIDAALDGIDGMTAEDIIQDLKERFMIK